MSMSGVQIHKVLKLLNTACESVENQANWDKQPYCNWYYDAKKLLKEIDDANVLEPWPPDAKVEV